MFTGIIHHTAPVLALTKPHVDSPNLRLTTTNPFPPEDPPKLGDSIAINGCCLTVAGMTRIQLAFDIIPETLSKTNLALLKPGQTVHLERALRASDRIDGHLVQGHIDTTAPLLSVSTTNEWRLTLASPPDLSKYLIPKGSITLDGVSLTIAAINGHNFDVTLIPTTLQLTTLGQRQPGYPFNLEYDPTVKTIVATLERMKHLT